MKGRILTATLCTSICGHAFAQDLTLQTTQSGGGLANGVMFDVTALNPSGIYLNHLFRVCSNQQTATNLWTRPGSFVGHENSSEGWTLVASDYFGCIGSVLVITASLNFQRVEPGQTIGMFMQTPAAPLVQYSTTPPGQSSYSDQHVQISGGIAKLGSGFSGTNLPGSIWNGAVSYRVGSPGCIANCDNSTAPPILTPNDFGCFINMFAAGVSRVNCDHSTSTPMLNVNDFMCFINAYAAGCTAP